MGPSPTLPGTLLVAPLVDVPHDTLPLSSTATMPIVSDAILVSVFECFELNLVSSLEIWPVGSLGAGLYGPQDVDAGGSTFFLKFGWQLFANQLLCPSIDLFEVRFSWRNSMSKANWVACEPTRKECSVRSMTALATEIAFFTWRRAPTAPTLCVSLKDYIYLNYNINN